MAQHHTDDFTHTIKQSLGKQFFNKINKIPLADAATIMYKLFWNLKFCFLVCSHNVFIAYWILCCSTWVFIWWFSVVDGCCCCLWWGSSAVSSSLLEVWLLLIIIIRGEREVVREFGWLMKRFITWMCTSSFRRRDSFFLPFLLVLLAKLWRFVHHHKMLTKQFLPSHLRNTQLLENPFADCRRIAPAHKARHGHFLCDWSCIQNWVLPTWKDNPYTLVVIRRVFVAHAWVSYGREGSFLLQTRARNFRGIIPWCKFLFFPVNVSVKSHFGLSFQRRLQC